MRPAPYLASRGLKWIQHFAKPGLSDAKLRDYIRQSHTIVAQGLSRKRRIELGLEARKAAYSASRIVRYAPSAPQAAIAASASEISTL